VISLQASNLGKVYRIYERPIDSIKELVLRRSFHEDFWALRGIDFTLPQGGSLGIIGENGAGKSTLLKLLAGTIKSPRASCSVLAGSPRSWSSVLAFTRT
jgi:lipopolysaccharide transport system ATP-binding protein